MSIRLSRTPLIAAFFYAAILTACADDQITSPTGYAKCAVPTTPIASIQGNRPASPLLDQQVTVQGVVTLVQDGQGLYMEEPGSDQDESTSNAIFVQTRTKARPTQFLCRQPNCQMKSSQAHGSARKAKFPRSVRGATL